MFFILYDSGATVSRSQKSVNCIEDLNNQTISPKPIQMNDSAENVAENVSRGENRSSDRNEADATQVDNVNVNGKFGHGSLETRIN
jgi:hypothetical protein